MKTLNQHLSELRKCDSRARGEYSTKMFACGYLAAIADLIEGMGPDEIEEKRREIKVILSDELAEAEGSPLA